MPLTVGSWHFVWWGPLQNMQYLIRLLFCRMWSDVAEAWNLYLGFLLVIIKLLEVGSEILYGKRHKYTYKFCAKYFFMCLQLQIWCNVSLSLSNVTAVSLLHFPFSCKVNALTNGCATCSHKSKEILFKIQFSGVTGNYNIVCCPPPCSDDFLLLSPSSGLKS
jgi:hypothetical protein